MHACIGQRASLSRTRVLTRLRARGRPASRVRRAPVVERLIRAALAVTLARLARPDRVARWQCVDHVGRRALAGAEDAQAAAADGTSSTGGLARRHRRKRRKWRWRRRRGHWWRRWRAWWRPRRIWQLRRTALVNVLVAVAIIGGARRATLAVALALIAHSEARVITVGQSVTLGSRWTVDGGVDGSHARWADGHADSARTKKMAVRTGRVKARGWLAGWCTPR